MKIKNLKCEHADHVQYALDMVSFLKKETGKEEMPFRLYSGYMPGTTNPQLYVDDLQECFKADKTLKKRLKQKFPFIISITDSMILFKCLKYAQLIISGK